MALPQSSGTVGMGAAGGTGQTGREPAASPVPALGTCRAPGGVLCCLRSTWKEAGARESLLGGREWWPGVNRPASEGTQLDACTPPGPLARRGHSDCHLARALLPPGTAFRVCVCVYVYMCVGMCRAVLLAVYVCVHAWSCVCVHLCGGMCVDVHACVCV